MFEKLTIIAPGLLGASIGMAVGKRRLAKSVSAWARRAEARAQLQQSNWCDDAPESLKEACADSSFIVLCAPVECIIELAQSIAPHIDSNPIVTDVGSVKSKLSRLSTAALNSKARFVGSHPMAGSEKTGMEHADPELFANRTCFVTPFEKTDPQALQLVSEFWKELGSFVISESPERHDEIVANVSHLPHMLASTLAVYLGSSFPDARDHCGSGLKDTTRIASGDPGMWRQIIIQNREEIVRALDGFQNELENLKRALVEENEFETLKMLTDGKAFRDSLDA